MRIDRLIIENFKGFDHREFQFHPSVNLLVGVNGSGKTSVLEALSVAMGAWFLGIRGSDSRHIRNDEVRLRATLSPGGRAREGERVNWESMYPCAIQASGVVMEKALSWRRELNTPEGRTTYGGAREVKEIAAKADQEVRAGGETVLPLLSYYGTGRLWDLPRVKSERTLVS